MPVPTDSPLSWRSLTAALNEKKAPNSFLMNTLFRRSDARPTKDIELSFIRRGRKMAPFVKRNGAAYMTTGQEEGFSLVRPPHIRIKRPLTPSELLDKRRAGTTVFIDAGGIQAAMRRVIADEQRNMMDDIENTEEWMAAQVLRGALSYSVDETQDSFEITFPRSADHDIDLGSTRYWTESTAKVEEDFLNVMTLTDDAVSLMPTDVILGDAAAKAFLEKAKTSNPLLDAARIRMGTVDFTQQIQSSGALFLGEGAHGIRVWRYGRSVTLPDGTTEKLIRPNYAEFVCNSPSAGFVALYGAIEDMKAIGAGRLLQSKRFSKTWEVEDPSARMMLVESNPLPFVRQPDATVSVKVVAD